MPRFVSAAAAEVYKKSNEEIGAANQILINDGSIERLFSDQQGGLEFDAAALQPVLGLAPGADADQDFGNVGGLLNLDTVDIEQMVAGMDARGHAGAVGFYV